MQTIRELITRRATINYNQIKRRFIVGEPTREIAEKVQILDRYRPLTRYKRRFALLNVRNRTPSQNSILRIMSVPDFHNIPAKSSTIIFINQTGILISKLDFDIVPDDSPRRTISG